MKIKHILTNLYNGGHLNVMQYLALNEQTFNVSNLDCNYKIITNDIFFESDDISLRIRITDGLTRHQRKLSKHNNQFNELFNFYVTCHIDGILSFCGSDVITAYDKLSFNAKLSFKLYENNEFNDANIITSTEPNILRHAILGKRSWGLWLNEWTDGINEGSFTKNEILSEFKRRNIMIPASLLMDFNNTLYKKNKFDILK